MTKRLDDATLESLLSGGPVPADAPESYAEASAVIRALRRAGIQGAQPPEDMTAQLVEKIRSSPPDASSARPRSPHHQSPVRAGRARVRLGLLVLLGALIAATGLAAAGALPDTAQEALSRFADSAGLRGIIPGADDPPPATPVEPDPAPDAVREAAQDPETSGVEKAETVLGSTPAEDATPESPPAPAPAQAGTDTADDWSGGVSEEGTETGKEASRMGPENAGRRGR